MVDVADVAGTQAAVESQKVQHKRFASVILLTLHSAVADLTHFVDGAFGIPQTDLLWKAVQVGLEGLWVNYP